MTPTSTVTLIFDMSVAQCRKLIKTFPKRNDYADKYQGANSRFLDAMETLGLARALYPEHTTYVLTTLGKETHKVVKDYLKEYDKFHK